MWYRVTLMPMSHVSPPCDGGLQKSSAVVGRYEGRDSAILPLVRESKEEGQIERFLQSLLHEGFFVDQN